MENEYNGTIKLLGGLAPIDGHEDMPLISSKNIHWDTDKINNLLLSNGSTLEIGSGLSIDNDILKVDTTGLSIKNGAQVSHLIFPNEDGSGALLNGSGLEFYSNLSAVGDSEEAEQDALLATITPKPLLGSTLNIPQLVCNDGLAWAGPGLNFVSKDFTKEKWWSSNIKSEYQIGTIVTLRDDILYGITNYKNQENFYDEHDIEPTSACLFGSRPRFNIIYSSNTDVRKVYPLYYFEKKNNKWTQTFLQYIYIFDDKKDAHLKNIDSPNPNNSDTTEIALSDNDFYTVQNLVFVDDTIYGINKSDELYEFKINNKTIIADSEDARNNNTRFYGIQQPKDLTIKKPVYFKFIPVTDDYTGSDVQTDDETGIRYVRRNVQVPSKYPEVKTDTSAASDKIVPDAYSEDEVQPFLVQTNEGLIDFSNIIDYHPSYIVYHNGESDDTMFYTLRFHSNRYDYIYDYDTLKENAISADVSDSVRLIDYNPPYYELVKISSLIGACINIYETKSSDTRINEYNPTAVIYDLDTIEEYGDVNVKQKALLEVLKIKSNLDLSKYPQPIYVKHKSLSGVYKVTGIQQRERVSKYDSMDIDTMENLQSKTSFTDTELFARNIFRVEFDSPKFKMVIPLEANDNQGVQLNGAEIPITLIDIKDVSDFLLNIKGYQQSGSSSSDGLNFGKVRSISSFDNYSHDDAYDSLGAKTNGTDSLVISRVSGQDETFDSQELKISNNGIELSASYGDNTNSDESVYTSTFKVTGQKIEIRTTNEGYAPEVEFYHNDNKYRPFTSGTVLSGVDCVPFFATTDDNPKSTMNSYGAIKTRKATSNAEARTVPVRDTKGCLGVATPQKDTDATNKKYVDDLIATLIARIEVLENK